MFLREKSKLTWFMFPTRLLERHVEIGLSRLQGYQVSRLQEGDAGIGFSRLQGYKGYRRGCRDRFLQATRLSRLQEGYAGIGSRVLIG